MEQKDHFVGIEMVSLFMFSVARQISPCLFPGTHGRAAACLVSAHHLSSSCASADRPNPYARICAHARVSSSCSLDLEAAYACDHQDVQVSFDGALRNVDDYDVLQIEEEFKKILGAKTGNPETPFALTSAASKEVGAGINTGIQ